MLRVLMIDDDRELCQLVSVCLVREGMEVKSQSPKAFSDYFRDFGQAADMHLSLYRPDGSDVLGTPTDATTRLWISEAAQDEKTHFPRRHGPPLMLHATTGPSGAKYILSSERASLPFAFFITRGNRHSNPSSISSWQIGRRHEILEQ
jgi:hypothetical protein